MKVPLKNDVRVTVDSVGRECRIGVLFQAMKVVVERRKELKTAQLEARTAAGIVLL